MKIFVVDDKAETAEALAQRLQEITVNCEFIPIVGGPQALEVAQQSGAPDVLITEVVMEDVDGFSLRETFRASRPNLRTIYVTGYDLTEYQAYLNGTPVLYKPVEPRDVFDVLPPAAKPRQSHKSASITDSLPPDQRTQSARLKRLVGKQGFTGKLDQFGLVDIIQMCCVSQRTGCLQISHRQDRGVIYLQNGQMIHAVTGNLEAEEAVYEIIGWTAGQFNFEEGIQPETQTIQGSGWERLVMEGVRRRDERTQAEGGGEDLSLDASIAGQMIGPYRLRRKLGQGERSQVYEATQLSMNRTVALKVLRPEFQADEGIVQHFLAEASAKANVQHPSILAVYEAGHAEEIYYYAREFVDGSNLADLRAQGRTFDDATALRLIRVASEALGHLGRVKAPHAPLTAEDLYLGRDRIPRLNNIAVVPNQPSAPIQHDMHALSRMVADCLPNRLADMPGLRALLNRMLMEGNNGFLSWAALLQAVKVLEPKAAPEDALKLSAQTTAAQAVVQEAKRRQKRSLFYSVLGMATLLALAAVVVYLKFFHVTVGRSFDKMLEVPAGEFVYQDGQKATLPAFWIDQYEVTIGQYEQFLEAMRANPTANYEHKDAPKQHRHDNDRWLNLYNVAKTGSRYNGAPLTLDCPAVFIDWFDAYAYAAWKGRRLPTEQEWEKAARGTDGRRFPWGNDATQISKVNTSADYNDNAHIAGETDGYNRWSPVDAMTGDKSPYGVMDMAGNVSEWTATVKDKSYPIIRGGNFGSPESDVTKLPLPRTLNLTISDRVGFRTASDVPPGKAGTP